MTKLKDENEVWHHDPESIKLVVKSYFMNLFASSTPMQIEEALERNFNTMDAEMKEFLSSPYSISEVKEAFFQMGVT